jgi:predicted nucleic acid-binding protein
VKGLSARDSVHLATMERHGVAVVMSFDRGFDAYPAVQRLGA